MSRNDKEYAWILWVTMFIVGTLLVTIAFLAAISDSSDAAEIGKCEPFDPGIEAVLKEAQASHGSLVIVPPPMMSGFIEGLGDKGKGVTGESALVLFTPPHKYVVFVKRGDALCVAISEDATEGTDL